jgi:hypothetical protein
MRLANVEHGHRWYVRGLFWVFRHLARLEVPDVLKAVLYRPAFFGLRFGEWAHEVMRGESDWTVGERELFAAYTSSLNQCVF